MSVRNSKSSKSTKAIDWRVYRVAGKKASLIGHVTAPDSHTALTKAYKEFDVTTLAERIRIMVLLS